MWDEFMHEWEITRKLWKGKDYILYFEVQCCMKTSGYILFLTRMLAGVVNWCIEFYTDWNTSACLFTFHLLVIVLIF